MTPAQNRDLVAHHHYDVISLAALWETTSVYFPLLAEQIAQMRKDQKA